MSCTILPASGVFVGEDVDVVFALVDAEHIHGGEEAGLFVLLEIIDLHLLVFLQVEPDGFSIANEVLGCQFQPVLFPLLDHLAGLFLLLVGAGEFDRKVEGSFHRLVGLVFGLYFFQHRPGLGIRIARLGVLV
ncbi:MAG: hypothetical protein IPG32_03390 [Saprospirales bacterium]|nr:hypothetical protein [Saprospirales bacterium]